MAGDGSDQRALQYEQTLVSLNLLLHWTLLALRKALCQSVDGEKPNSCWRRRHFKAARLTGKTCSCCYWTLMKNAKCVAGKRVFPAFIWDELVLRSDRICSCLLWFPLLCLYVNINSWRAELVKFSVKFVLLHSHVKAAVYGSRYVLYLAGLCSFGDNRSRDTLAFWYSTVNQLWQFVVFGHCWRNICTNS